MTDNGDQSFIRVKYGGKYPNTDHLERAVRLGKGGGAIKREVLMDIGIYLIKHVFGNLSLSLSLSHK